MSTSEAEEVPSNHAAQLLTAQAFREAIEAYCSKHGNGTDDVYSYAVGWTFGEGTMPPRTCHLRRQFLLAGQDERMGGCTDETGFQDVQEPCDDAAASARSLLSRHAFIVCEQLVAYSSIWKVPVLYFRAHTRDFCTQDGAPLAFDDLISTSSSLFRDNVFVSSDGDQDGLRAASFPSIGVGESPVQGDTWAFLHPCHTASWLAMLSQRHHADKDDGRRGYVDSFMMLCSTTVEMRIASSQLVE